MRDDDDTSGRFGRLERGALVVSIDVEMAWGQIHRPTEVYEFADERAQMRRLLDLFDEHAVPATWAFVGHLLLEECHRTDGLAHPDLVRPNYEWFEGDWLAADPCRTWEDSPTWYAPDLVAEVIGRETPHEIGSHAFSHLIAGDPGCSEAAFRSDLRHCREAAQRAGVSPTAFVYPRNQYGFEDVLGDEGFTSYRGPRSDPLAGLDGVERRVRRLADLAVPTSASAVRPVASAGVWNLPATYLHDVGSVRRYPLRLLQARRRLRQAARHRSLFHVWFHPHNVAHEPDRWFDGLDDLLRRAARLRDQGRLDTLTMSAVADRLGQPPATAPPTRESRRVTPDAWPPDPA